MRRRVGGKTALVEFAATWSKTGPGSTPCAPAPATHSDGCVIHW
ncbi:hypothetical protein roselon_02695 [Roseibacterium elongatum DSM 19469]|uniref:Uncharacterized protein n=1 Tax=Roseicyclus elongatus DSM 19469 TaxID=1294273 RepID=W8RUX0_9RHOB|nr:hypothetical protein roselon_02695 [Roseibacterium elongatum DSM 19469]